MCSGVAMGSGRTPHALVRYAVGTVREVVLAALVDIEERGAYTAIARDRALAVRAWEARDRALITELVCGTVHHRSALDARICAHVHRPIAQWVRTLLQCAVYQLLVLERIPAHAVVHESVHIARKHGHEGIAGLVNAVLRAVAKTPRLRDCARQSVSSIDALALAYAHPQWIVERMVAAYGWDIAISLLVRSLQPPPMTVRVNTLRCTRGDVLQQMGNVRPTEVSHEGVVMLDWSGDISKHALYTQGKITVQDEAAMLVTDALDVQPGMRVLDACAAPGGKTTHIAERMGDRGEVVALDVHAHKLLRVQEHAQRLGLYSVRTMGIDAVDAHAYFSEGTFDAILLDVPCSGLGVLRRRPDIKWRRTEEQCAALVDVQRALLDAVHPLLRPGGVLVYSTCTVGRQENDDQISAFLERCPSMEADVLPAHIPGRSPYTTTLLPMHGQMDSFFIARMRKKGRA
jgi:16S rRNA (cytosine967-C5)-methyltransferase